MDRERSEREWALSGSGKQPASTQATPKPAERLPVAGKRTLAETLPAASTPVQRKVDAGATPVIPTGPRRTLVELFGGGVQRKAVSAGTDVERIHASAQRGVATTTSPLPHADRIQRLFGRHDISTIKAHTGGDAAASARAMGAAAYATGDHVVLGEGADLHTVAHEVAHVVQQRGGVQLQGGVGAIGDPYERHADAVADRIVQGKSAEDLLDMYAAGGGAPPARAPVHDGQSAVHRGDGLEREADEIGGRAARTEPTGAPAPSASVVQRVQETPTSYPPPSEIKSMNLDQLDAYAHAQADWFAGPDLEDNDRDQIRGALEFARKPGILASCGSFEVKDVFELDEEQRGQLSIYAGYFVSGNPFRMTRPLWPRTAIRRGQDLPLLIAEFGGGTLSEAMDEGSLDGITRGLEAKPSWTADVITYHRGAEKPPYFQATSDFASYKQMREKDKKDPVDYASTPLHGKIRNFHRFEGAALDRLIQNFNDRSRKLPVTLILHSAVDHNGAFHRSQGLTKVITSSNILALMIEGGETLAEYANEIGPLAKSYGLGGKLDQVLLSGHGQMRSMEMAGSPAAHDNIDLDENAQETAELFGAIFDHLDSGTKQSLEQLPDVHRRMVFNACLTNTNHVPVQAIPRGDSASMEEIAKAVRTYIDDHPTLKVHTEQQLKHKQLTGWSVEGANAVTRANDFIHKDTGRLSLSSDEDKEITGDKLDYVAFGVEPIGVFRAAVECLTWTNPKVVEACITDMQSRSEVQSDDWRATFIAAGFTFALKQDEKDRPFVLSFLSSQAGSIETLVRYSSARVSALRNLCLLGKSVLPFFQAFAHSRMWKQDHFSLVMLQAWMNIENTPTVREDFLQIVAPKSCSWLKPLIDVASLGGKMAELLDGGPSPAKLRLALLGVLAPQIDASAREYLRVCLGGRIRFDPSLGVAEALDGVSTPDAIQDLIGLPVQALEQQVEKTGNVRLEGDDTNKEWVRSITRTGKITKQTGATLYAKPADEAEQLAQLPQDTELHLFGEVGEWFAAERSIAGSKVREGYVNEADLAEDHDKTVDNDNVEFFKSAGDYDGLNDALFTLPGCTPVVVLEEGLGTSNDLVKIRITRNEKRFSAAFVKKADVG